MKKYNAPVAEKISFDYKDQVVASNEGPGKDTPTCYAITPYSFLVAPCADTIVGDSFMNN